MSRGDFRGRLPLDDRDFATIRARVMETIDRRPFVPIALRLGLAAAAVAALVFVLLPLRTPAPAKSPAVQAAPRAFGVRRPGAALIVKAVPRHRTPKARVVPIAVASKGSPPSASDMIMEIHTADPDVRIIWIASR